MRREKISEVIDNIGTKYVDEATGYKGKAKSSKNVVWYKWGAVAACFAVLVFGGVKVIPMLIGEGLDDSQGKYKYQVSGMEADIEWTWEYKTLGEKYQTVIYDGKEYNIKNLNPVSLEVLGQKIGVGDASGVDSYTDKKYVESFEIYEINDVSAEKLIAAGVAGEYYVYQTCEAVEKPATFGELMLLYGLDENLDFNHFTAYEGHKSQGYYDLSDDEYIWQVLSECDEATLDNTVDSFDRSNRTYLSFTATSEALGVYKRVVYISEDGYFATNIFNYSYIYYIGTEAAGKIIEYAKNNSEDGKMEAYELSVSGTVVEIGDGYVLIDDSVLCKNQEDGTVYKIYINDIRIKRCVECAGIKVGDVVAVKYNGEITDTNEVTGAYSMYKGTLVDGGLEIPE